jgi:hypothetical protein
MAEAPAARLALGGLEIISHRKCHRRPVAEVKGSHFSAHAKVMNGPFSFVLFRELVTRLHFVVADNAGFTVPQACVGRLSAWPSRPYRFPSRGPRNSVSAGYFVEGYGGEVVE